MRPFQVINSGPALLGRDRRTEAPAPLPVEDVLVESPCPACGDHVAVPFWDGGHQPLTTLAWPESAEEAHAMERLPLRFVRCVGCGHVFNQDFQYDKVPYSTRPNLMFNRGALWRRHLEAVSDAVAALLPERPVVVEIGCGDGHFLRSLADRRPDGRYLGFDVNGRIEHAGGAVEAHPILFEPERHLREHRPDLIVSRHLLEHLSNPLGFIQKIGFAAAWEGLATRVFFEVPCIDRALEAGRTADFFYEHNSHFTFESFRRLLSRCTDRVERVETGYDGEVVYGVARVGGRRERVARARAALAFGERARASMDRVRAGLDALARSGQRVAIWGGTGKAAAFINVNGLDADRFAVVVDSDPAKAGTHVPGTGQRIRTPDALCEHPVDVVVIATQWRARDIVMEMAARGIVCARILLEHDGHLVDYHADTHPYRTELPALASAIG